MNLDYTSRLIYEDLTAVQFLEHCSNIFRNKINPIASITSQITTSHSVEDTNSIKIEKTRLEEFQDEMDELRLMNSEQQFVFGTKKRESEIAGYKHSIKDGLDIRKKLIDMQNQVQRWNATSPEFELLKDFVITQVQTAVIDNNQDITHYETELDTCEKRSSVDYYKYAVYQVKKNIEYYQNLIAEKTEKLV